MNLDAWSSKYVERLKTCQPGLRKMVDSIIDALLPWRCVVCGLSCEEQGICLVCKAAFPWNHNACGTCAIPMTNPGDPLCGACLAKPPAFDGTFSPLLFKFPIDRLIHKFKFERNLAAGAVLGRILIEKLSNLAPSLPDLLVPVPMHRFRLLHRGFNQSFELARQIGNTLTIPVAVHELHRHRHTPAQSGLDAIGRRKNLKDAFRWRGRNLKGLNVVLVDDVMTTGSTIAECTRTLKRAGARSVSAWTLARATQ